MKPGAVIKEVRSPSVGSRVGLQPGDVIETINGRPVMDVLDFLYLTAAPRFKMQVVRGAISWDVDVQRTDQDEPLGMDLEEELTDGIRRCRCKCDFCFLDQMPKGYRPTLYVKDDDYRLSFLYGNFVTLTNLDEADWLKIRDYNLSPMYVSVHATDPEVRRQVLKNPRSGDIMDQLKRLQSWGIDMHTQLVITPGINDGEQIDRSIGDLATLWPDVLSIGVVPVGLTRWRDKCAPLNLVTPEHALRIVRQVEKWQKRFEDSFGTPFVFLSDEFYLLSGQPFPGLRHYRDFPQLENGVGLSRLLLTEFARRERHLPKRLSQKRKVVVLTGTLGGQVLQGMVRRLNAIGNLTVHLEPVVNEFLGDTVTVAGLLGGGDIRRTLKRLGEGFDLAVFPNICLKDSGAQLAHPDDGLFLDDLTVGDVRRESPCPVVAIPPRSTALIGAVLGQPEKRGRIKDLKWVAV